jgi:hypothetical protein
MAGTDDSLIKAARENRIVAARCRRCRNQASFLAADLIGFADPQEPISALRFRCGECDSRDYEIESLELDRDRRPDIIVWRPTRLR